jgi:hypothetical protein
MQVATNTSLVRRRTRQAQVLSLLGLAVLLAGLLANLRQPSAGAAVGYFTLILGTTLSLIGISLSDKWVRPPRADVALTRALDRLGAGYKLYNWLLPAEHVLLTPAGVLVILVKSHAGRVECHAGRWRHRRSAWERIRDMGRRPLGRPDAELTAEIEAFGRLPGLAESGAPLPGAADGVIVFTSRDVRLAVDECGQTSVHVGDLREWLREWMRGRQTLTPAVRRRLQSALDAAEAGQADAPPGERASRRRR